MGGGKGGASVVKTKHPTVPVGQFQIFHKHLLEFASNDANRIFRNMNIQAIKDLGKTSKEFQNLCVEQYKAKMATKPNDTSKNAFKALMSAGNRFKDTLKRRLGNKYDEWWTMLDDIFRADWYNFLIFINKQKTEELTNAIKKYQETIKDEYAKTPEVAEMRYYVETFYVNVPKDQQRIKCLQKHNIELPGSPSTTSSIHNVHYFKS